MTVPLTAEVLAMTVAQLILSLKENYKICFKFENRKNILVIFTHLNRKNKQAKEHL